jgi:hypothetical protein
MKNMKTNLLIAGLAALSAAVNASAQTNASPNLIPTVDQSFFQSVGGYLSTINTNYTFTNDTLEVSVGAGEAGPLLANYVKVQYDFGPNLGLARWEAGATVRNAGVAGVIQTAELGAGYKVIAAYDTTLTAALEGGFDWNKDAALFEGELLVRKKATKNTFFETGITLPEWTKGRFNLTPGFFVGTGFTY